MRVIKAEEQKIKAPTILLYGNEGIGKTTFTAQFKNPIYVRTEEGFPAGIRCDAFPVCKTGEEVIEYIKELTNEDHDYKTLVVDCIDGVEKIVHQRIMEQSKSEDMAGACGGFGRAYEQADNFMINKLLPAINSLREAKNMWIVLIDHATVIDSSDLNGNFKWYEPACIHRKKDKQQSWIEQYRNWVDNVWFATGSSSNMAVGYGANQRVIRCEETRQNVGKNRLGLTGQDAIIPMDFKSVYNLFVNAYNKDSNKQ